MELTIRNAALETHPGRLMDIGIHQGRIAAIEPSLPPGERDLDAGGRLAIAGFVESHIHLDKACIADRCAIKQGTLAEAIEQVAKAKRDFDEDDVAERASRVLAMAVGNGVTRMRTQLEVDPVIGLKGLAGVLRAIEAFKWAIDVEICIFPQEGLLNYPGVEALMLQALNAGGTVVGGAPYTDSNPHGQIDRLFDIARDLDRDIDMHLDFDLDASWLDVEYVCAKAQRRGWQGRVSVGHATKLSALPPQRLEEVARTMADAGVRLMVMPATDIFLMGRQYSHNIPRGLTPAHTLLKYGVTCALSTNNVLNPFTPFGDCSLIRLANLYANVCQVGTSAGLADCLAMVTTLAAQVLGCSDYGLTVGNPGDVVLLDARDASSAVAEIASPLYGFKAGQPTFTRMPPTLHAGF